MSLPYDNETLLQEVKDRLLTGQLSSETVRGLTESESNGLPSFHLPNFSMVKLLYIVGGIIVMLGIIFFVGQIWDDLGSVGRVVVTLGVGLSLAWSGTYFLKTDSESLIGDALHALGGFLIPFGSLVLLSELSSDVDTLWPLIFVFFIITLFYLALTLIYRRSILTFFLIGGATITDWLLIYELFPNFGDTFYLHCAMLTGAVYVYLAYVFRAWWNPYLLGLLTFSGGAAFFIAAFANLFEGSAVLNSLYELLYPVLAIGGMYLATKVVSRGLLLVSTIALISYLIYLTGEYFADSIGWPLAMIFVGFAIMGIGYTSLRISRRYIHD